MSKQSTSFEIGFALGSVVREFRRALSRPPVVVCSGQPIPDSGLSFSSATAGGNPSLN